MAKKNAHDENLAQAATRARDILGRWEKNGRLWSACEETIWEAWKSLDAALHEYGKKP